MENLARGFFKTAVGADIFDLLSFLGINCALPPHTTAVVKRPRVITKKGDDIYVKNCGKSDHNY